MVGAPRWGSCSPSSDSWGVAPGYHTAGPLGLNALISGWDAGRQERAAGDRHFDAIRFVHPQQAGGLMNLDSIHFER